MKKASSMRVAKENRLVKELLEEFLLKRKAENLAEKTLSSYQYNCTRFIKFLENNSIFHIEEVNEEVFLRFKLFLQSIIENQTSINTIIRENTVFLKYCMEQEYIDKFQITIPKEQEKLKETYTDDEIEKLLRKPNIKKCRFPTYRNWVLCNYFLGTGNRLNAVINLKIKDLDLKARKVKMRITKNKIQQEIPLSSTLVKVLQVLSL